MRNLFSTTETILALVILVFVGTTFYGLEYRTYAARQFHSNCISRIQSSFYSEEVIEQCELEAAERGYRLEVQNVTIYDDRRDVKVSLTYEVPKWMSSETEEATLVGYAR